MKLKTLQFGKAMRAALFVLLLSVAGMTKALAQTFTVGNLNYSVNDDGISVTVTGHVDGQNATGELVIPESVELYGTTYPVTAIGYAAFSGCSGLTGSLVIPNSVVTIGRYSFQYCYGFTSLALGNAVQSIGESAFYSTGFTGTLTIPESVTYMEWGAFAYCNGFTSLTYNAINCGGNDEWLYATTSMTTLNIGENVQTIPNYFLNGLTSFTGELVIPESVTSIGENAFSGCTGFTGSLNIGDAVTTIGANAFSGCSGLSGSLTLGSSLTEIGNSAFFGACEGFTSFDVKPETPPTLGTNVFTSANFDTPVQVPCGSLDAYQNASGWSLFTNIQEPNPCMWEITATANPSSGGTVSGAGIYEQGQTCTLTATPNEGISFVNWTENGVEVSTEATYSFTVEGNRNLVANFVIPTYTVSVMVNPNNIGSVAFDGEEFPVSDFYDFEDSSMGGWTTIDADGDGYNWMINSQWNASAQGHNGSSDFVMSESYNNNGVLYPDNYLVSPKVQLGGSFSFYASCQDYDYSAEHFGVAVSVSDRFNPDSFITIQEWTMSAKGVGLPTEATRNGNRGGQGNWYYFTVDLSNYSGYGYIAIRHFNCSDMWHLNVDDITLPSVPLASNTYFWGDTCTLTATPNSSNIVFLNWTENGEVVSSTAQYAFAVTNDRDLVANFLQISCEITVSGLPESWGTVTGGGNYMVGQTCTLTATPNEGYEFYHWIENGEVVSTEAVYSFVATSNRALTARFRSANSIVFADQNVEAICVNHWDTDGDGFLSYDEAAAVTNLGQVFYYHSEITSFDELQYFTGLTQINYREFYNCYNLTSVTLPEGITSIGSYAFYYCSSLTGDLVIPNSVTDIQDDAFYGCDGFNGSLTIGANVNYMDYGAFGYAGFTTVNYNAINCSSLEGWLWNPETITTLNIGENVEVIPYAAFSYFSNLTGDLVIPNSVTSIGDDAFSGCSSLTSVALGNSLTSIGNAAFNSCSGLASIVIPNSVTEIGSWAFGNCSSLTSASLPEGMTSINEGVFGECPSLTSVVFPSALETIGHYAFQSCGLTSLELPNTVTSIGIGAFSNCTSISGTLELPASVATIGEEAFYNCTGLHSIIMSEDIHSIGSRAFKNCSGLRGELTLPELLESVGGEAFYGCDGISTVNYNAINCHYMGSAGTPVFYDCAFTRLNIGENVTTIPDFAFKRCFMLTEMYVGAVVPPTLFSSTFGMVSRSIPVSVPYGTGDTYRNAPYWEEFFNIIDDYTPTQYAYHWTFDIHDYEYNMTVVGVIHINGVEQETNALEIGAFCGDECRGRQMLAYHPIADRYVVFLMIYGNPDDLITFRLYDHATGEESTMNCANSITFETDASFGTLTSPYVFNFGNTMQTSTFSPGWNWWSTYLETQGYNSLAMLEEALGTNALQIKSQSDFAQYLEIPGYGGYWYGTLDTIISNEQSYKVQISSACQIVLNGTPVSPADHPITIQPGWNWIGFPSSTAISFADAFAGFTPTDGDQVKSQNGFSQYMEIAGYGGLWYGGLEAGNLTPGMGLMYKSMDSGTATLVYPNAGRSVENLVSIEKHWNTNVHAYPGNMTLVAVVELDDVELSSDRYELAAFANGECRGSAKLTFVEPINRHMAFLTISGDEATELSFGLYDNQIGTEIFDCSDLLTYSTDATVGNLIEPMVIRFRGTTGLEDLDRHVQVFPNPVKQGERIHVGVEAETMGTVRIDIVNAFGIVVASTTSNALPASITAPAIPGVYMLRIAVDDQGICMRKLVVE